MHLALPCGSPRIGTRRRRALMHASGLAVGGRPAPSAFLGAAAGAPVGAASPLRAHIAASAGSDGLGPACRLNPRLATARVARPNA